MRGWRARGRYEGDLQRTASCKVETGRSAMVGQGGRRRWLRERGRWPGGEGKRKGKTEDNGKTSETEGLYTLRKAARRPTRRAMAEQATPNPNGAAPGWKPQSAYLSPGRRLLIKLTLLLTTDYSNVESIILRAFAGPLSLAAGSTAPSMPADRNTLLKLVSAGRG